MISGASSGIGLATANLFLKKKYRVINLSRTPCDLPNIVNIEIDLSQKDSLENLKKNLPQIFEEKQKITLVHNAFQYFYDSVVNFSSDKMEKAFKVGIIAPGFLNQSILPYMQENSSILYIGSTLSEKAVAGCMSYVTLKHALVGLMRSCAQDDSLRERKIHTACLCPGFTETKMLKKHASEEVLKNITKENVFFKRLILPEEIARFVYFCSKNPVIHGSVLHSNLGQMES
jgi:NAD(P)-dependent dehydrogenase (short-subunit alcohol dehydrogenase family)